jgi:hypothetical protein
MKRGYLPVSSAPAEKTKYAYAAASVLIDQDG